MQILLHNPTETPKIGNYGISLTIGTETRVVVTPRIADASDAVKSIGKSYRKCMFSHESNLTYFR